MGIISNSRNTFGRGSSLEIEKGNSSVDQKKYKHHKCETKLQR